MQLPKRLDDILKIDHALDGAVKLSISQFEPWIKHSNLPFFPEYTKHDIEHIEAVIRTASGIIREEAWETITSGDVAVLIIGILLHDCAMHLSEDGFFSLLNPDRCDKSVPWMQDKPWNVLWEDFFGEASRFDGRILTQLFGDSQPVRRPPLNPTDFTKRDRLLIGEFLRRHHPRLAQEIAIYGVPTKSNPPLILEGLSGDNAYIADLSGLIARSHGENVRAYLPQLFAKFNVREYRGVHAVFLMALLRVADYLQIGPERAPKQVLQIKQLASPVSQGEWYAHQAIKDIRHTHEDPEALFIDAFPEDIKTFFRIQTWLHGIQDELDASWAVLGEVYGRYDGLNSLGLVLRRVRSSIDDVESFSMRVNYLPVKAAFKGSDTDLLKLLIEPLYGNRPAIGLRELIQNAVDAVIELEQYLKDVPSLRSRPRPLQDADVIVAVEKNSKGEVWLNVSDKGIGMSRDVVVNYFLTAGASYRRSEDWKKRFETEKGKSKILRAGRFGIGALATFLLGPEIQVSTRHVEDIHGIDFSATIETESIELRKIDRPVGTTIRIRVADNVVIQLEQLSKQHNALNKKPDVSAWDWYCLSSPSVKRVIYDNTILQSFHLPNKETSLPLEWRRVSHPDFVDIQWTYSDSPGLVCNGIKILDPASEWDVNVSEAKWETRFGLKLPNINVFDPDGLLPLNLQRDELTENVYPFDLEIVEDVIRDLMAFALVNGPKSCPNHFLKAHSLMTLRYAGSRRPRNPWRAKTSEDWYFTNEGYGYADLGIFQKRGFSSVLFIRPGNASRETVGFKIPKSLPVIYVQGDTTVYALDDFIKRICNFGFYQDEITAEKEKNWDDSGVTIVNLTKRRGVRFLISDFALERMSAKMKISKVIKNALRKEWSGKGYHIFVLGTCPQSKFDFPSMVNKAGNNIGQFTSFSEVYLDFGKEIELSPIGSKWLKTFGNLEIPFSEEKRRVVLKHACRSLSSYIERHRALKNKARKQV